MYVYMHIYMVKTIKIILEPCGTLCMPGRNMS